MDRVPGDVLDQIRSYLDTKEVCRTCTVSTRWRDMSNVPMTLNLYSPQLPTGPHPIWSKIHGFEDYPWFEHDSVGFTRMLNESSHCLLQIAGGEYCEFPPNVINIPLLPRMKHLGFFGARSVGAIATIHSLIAKSPNLEELWLLQYLVPNRQEEQDNFVGLYEEFLPLVTVP